MIIPSIEIMGGRAVQLPQGRAVGIDAGDLRNEDYRNLTGRALGHAANEWTRIRLRATRLRSLNT